MADLTVWIPYPDGPDNAIQPGNLYDAEEWRVWLGAFGFDIDVVYRVEFWPDDQCTIYQYRRGWDGRYFALGNEVAVVDPITVHYETPPPVWS